MSLDFKNITSGPSVDIDLSDITRRIVAASQRVMDPTDYLNIAQSATGGDVQTAIDNDDMIVILDGTELSKSGSLIVCRMLISTARVSSGDKDPGVLEDKIIAGAGVSVSKTGTGANEKLSISADGGGGVGGIETITYFSGSADSWMLMDTSGGKKSDRLTYFFTFPCKLLSVMYSNEKVGTKFKIEIHKALSGSGNNNNPVFLWTQNTLCRGSTKATGTDTDVANLSDVTFAVGDKMGLYIHRNGGAAPGSIEVMLQFQITNDTKTDSVEDFSGVFTI